MYRSGIVTLQSHLHLRGAFQLKRDHALWRQHSGSSFAEDQPRLVRPNHMGVMQRRRVIPPDQVNHCLQQRPASHDPQQPRNLP
jgi:hypothetical protein